MMLGVTSASALRSYFLWCWGNLFGCRGLNPGLLCKASALPYILSLQLKLKNFNVEGQSESVSTLSFSRVTNLFHHCLMLSFSLSDPTTVNSFWLKTRSHTFSFYCLWTFVIHYVFNSWHMREIILYKSLSFWLTSPGLILLRYIHVVANYVTWS